MSKILLIHNSDTYFETLKPASDDRPNFYWYTDRFVSHIGTSKYLYIFLVDPKQDGVELRSRSSEKGFDGMHRDYLNYRDYCEGRLPNQKYAESGVAMSFSELKPAITLMARSLASGKEEWLQDKFEIITPHKPFSKRVISLFEAPYTELYSDVPIKFADIPELAELILDKESIFPIHEAQTDHEGHYIYEDWLPMPTRQEGTWL